MKKEAINKICWIDLIIKIVVKIKSLMFKIYKILQEVQIKGIWAMIIINKIKIQFIKKNIMINIKIITKLFKIFKIRTIKCLFKIYKLIIK